MRLVIILLLFSFVTYAKDLGTVGNTYPVAEKDLMSEIEERAAKVDWKSIIRRETENVKKNAGKGGIFLPKAEKNRSFYLNMTYVLDHDINTYNQKGEITGILYQKGFVYNPLDYVKVKETYVVFNGKRQKEIDWFKAKYSLVPLVYPLITEGNAIEIANHIGRPVYVLRDDMRKLFKLEHTVSVIYPEGKRMRVDEIMVSDEKVNSVNTSRSYKHK